MSVTIFLSANKSVSPEIFTWNATGGIVDGGTWTDVTVLWTAINSPVVGTLHDSFVLTSGNGKGTLKIRFDGVVTATNVPNVLDVTGNWRILSGTGGYEKTLGNGKGKVTINNTTKIADAKLTGQVH